MAAAGLADIAVTVVAAVVAVAVAVVSPVADGDCL